MCVRASSSFVSGVQDEVKDRVPKIKESTAISILWKFLCTKMIEICSKKKTCKLNDCKNVNVGIWSWF